MNRTRDKLCQILNKLQSKISDCDKMCEALEALDTRDTLEKCLKLRSEAIIHPRQRKYLLAMLKAWLHGQSRSEFESIIGSPKFVSLPVTEKEYLVGTSTQNSERRIGANRRQYGGTSLQQLTKPIRNTHHVVPHSHHVHRGPGTLTKSGKTRVPTNTQVLRSDH